LIQYIVSVIVTKISLSIAILFYELPVVYDDDDDDDEAYPASLGEFKSGRYM